MKTIIIISLCFFLSASSTAQNKDISLIRDRNRVLDQNQEQFQFSDSLKAKNRNETGIKTKSGQTEQSLTSDKLKRKKDVFIDKDGDGINDSRVSGMSFSKIRKRYQNKQGGNGNGNNGGHGSGG